MTETTREKRHRAAVLMFMAAVTAVLLALAFGQAARGAAGLPAVVVYAFAAGFGLEFIGSA
jgi:hypothetical protein